MVSNNLSDISIQQIVLVLLMALFNELTAYRYHNIWFVPNTIR